MVSMPFFFSMCKFACNVKREHRALEKIVREYAIDYVFSDNRLGLYTKLATTIYMTHQFNFDNGFLNRFSASIMKKLHRHYINKYDFCCVPDGTGEKSLSGILSETDLKVMHLGPLSRFEEQLCSDSIISLTERSRSGDCSRESYDLLILSGIEPQRSILEKIFIDKYAKLPSPKLIIVRGLVGEDCALEVPDNILYENCPSDCRLAELIISANRIFCRSGYSTLCDLAALKRRAVLIPTPKQPEQEYLAQRFKSEFGFQSFSQSDLPFVDFSQVTYESDWNYDFYCNLKGLM